jgi:hypothetical protein
MMTMATITLLGCGGNTTTAQPDAAVHADAGVHADASVQPEAFELQGQWLYLGPWDGEHTIKISNGSVIYSDINGEWSSTWTLKDYDNGLHHFQMVFDSGTGTYLPVGQKISGTYVLDGQMLTVQLTDGLGSYSTVQSPGSCTAEGGKLISDCRLYVKQ